MTVGNAAVHATTAALSLALLASCGSGEPDFPRILARVTVPEQHSGVSVDTTFTVLLSGRHIEEPISRTQERAAAPQYVQLWDLDTRALVPSDVIPGDEISGGAPLQLKPRQPLTEGREYGVRIEPKSNITGNYFGTGGEFDRQSADGELCVVYVGSRPRVWELGFKGGRNIMLTFTEPVFLASPAGAVTLTNVRTGKDVTLSGLPTEPSLDPTISAAGAQIDVSAEHRLTITRAVTTAAGVALDGDFSGRPGGADFVLTLSPSQLDLFVNGYPSMLELSCNHNMVWWNPRTGAPNPPHDTCR